MTLLSTKLRKALLKYNRVIKVVNAQAEPVIVDEFIHTLVQIVRNQATPIGFDIPEAVEPLRKVLK